MFILLALFILAVVFAVLGAVQNSTRYTAVGLICLCVAVGLKGGGVV